MGEIEFLEKIKSQFTLLEKGEELLFDTSFKKLKSWDSMTALMVITTVHDDYGVSINGDDLKEINTIKELYDFVSSKLLI